MSIQRTNLAFWLCLSWLAGCSDDPAGKSTRTSDVGGADGGTSPTTDGAVLGMDETDGDAGNESGHDASAGPGASTMPDASATSDAGTTPDAAHIEDGGPIDECAPSHLATIVGTYREQSGLEHWLRSSITAQLYAQVPIRPARPSALPALRLVEAACDRGDHGSFVVSSRDAQRQRWDWLRRPVGLALCSTALGNDSKESLLSAAAPDSGDLKTGCYGKPWAVTTEIEQP
jgi:hypothetical protein